MKTIEQASLENSKTNYIMAFSEEIHQYADIDFRAGITFAQQWIPIEEEFPDFGTWIIAKRKNTYAAARIHGEVDVKFIKMNFTHWRPIELK
jgi:hypothetical protein